MRDTIEKLLQAETYRVEMVSQFGEVTAVLRHLPLRLIEPIAEASGLQGYTLTVRREAEEER